MIMFFLVCFSCQNKTGDDENKVCKVNDPLTDLPWLKAVIEKWEESGYYNYRISQCSFKDGTGKGGTGFILEPCVGCIEFGFSLRNCEGVSLCASAWGHSGEDTCGEFYIKIIKIICEN